MRNAFTGKINRLHQLKTLFNPEAAQQKLLLLGMLARLSPSSCRSLQSYHDTLLFLSAFPDSEKVAGRASEELFRLKSILSRYGSRKELINSGLEHTLLKWKPSLDALQWLLRYSGDLRFTVKSRKKMEEITALLCSKTEWDSLLDAEVSFSGWLQQLSGSRKNDTSVLASWLNRFQQLKDTPAVRDFLFDSLGLKSVCVLDYRWSVSSNKLLSLQPYFYKHKPEWKHNEKLNPVYLNQKTSSRILNSIKAALYARQKETDPVTYADERFLRGYETEDGFTVFLLSMKPVYRLPLESYIGYMVYSNGIPVAYGGAWIFFESCEFGINIFEQFRGGPSARIFNVLMNVYKHHYGIKQFIIPPYQFGEGNREGIKSGAFWFYYKTGFRPMKDELKNQAGREWNKIIRNDGYRTPEKVLLRFTGSPMVWKESSRPLFIPEPEKLSYAALKWIAGSFQGDAAKAMRHSADDLLRQSRMTRKGWKDSEKKLFEELSPFVCMIPGWQAWKRNELQQAVLLLKEKGNDEHRFIRMLQEHQKLRKGLNAAASAPGSKQKN